MKVGDFIDTKFGPREILNITNIGLVELYDLTLEDTPIYYSNNVVSHNSGKSITVASYLCWLFCFKRNINIGIVANRSKQAQEFLFQVKDIFKRLPIWLTPGIAAWNQLSISSEFNTRVLVDVPSVDSFRGFTMNVIVVDECAFIPSSKWNEFADAIFPSQSALSWKKNIIISTANGINHFQKLVAQTREGLPNSALVEVDYAEVPRYNSKGLLIPPEEFKEQIIKKFGKVYFEQNYGNSFLGSSDTLIDADILKNLVSESPLYTLKEHLNIYEEPEDGNVYLIGVDSSKGGDNFSVQIIDVSKFPFKQVASANMKVDYMGMHNFVEYCGFLYNNAHIIIENNEGSGQSIADALWKVNGYPNLYFDPGKKYPGFRTTTKTRDLILKTLKIMINNSQLILKDNKTIQELYRFENVDGKYQASEGTDDAIMALALCFVPFLEIKNFGDYNEYVQAIQSRKLDYVPDIIKNFTGFVDF